MTITRAKKEERVEQLHDELAEISHAILVDFRGLDVAAATDLRRRLHDLDASFRVVKNSLALRAVADLPLEELEDAFVGQTAVAYTQADVVGLAKTLRDFADEFETPTFKAGVVDGETISAEEFATIADMPSRDELVAKALWLMQYPVSGLVTALGGIVRGFVSALAQIHDKKESGELPAGPAAESVEAAADEAEDGAGAEEEAADDADAEEQIAGDADAEEQAAGDADAEEQAAAPEEAAEGGAGDEAADAEDDDAGQREAAPEDPGDEPADEEDESEQATPDDAGDGEDETEVKAAADEAGDEEEDADEAAADEDDNENEEEE